MRHPAETDQDYVDAHHAEDEIEWLFVCAQTETNYMPGSDLPLWLIFSVFVYFFFLFEFSDKGDHTLIYEIQRKGSNIGSLADWKVI